MRSKRERENDHTRLEAVLYNLPTQGPNSPFRYLGKVEGVESVSVSVHNLKPEHDLHLMDLLTCIFSQEHPALSVVLELPDHASSVTSEFNCDFNEGLLQYPSFVYNTVLWSCLIRTLQHNTKQFNAMVFAKALIRELGDCHKSTALWWNLCINLVELYRLSQHEAAFHSVFQVLAPLLISHNQLIQFTQLIDIQVLKQAVRKVDMAKKPLLLHYAMQTTAATIETVDKVFELLDGRPSHLIDDAGNSLLHVCRHLPYLMKGVIDIRDIYRPNAAGDYPIHLAARTANLAKAQYLFKYMLDPEIKNDRTGETFSSIVAHAETAVDKSNALNIYRRFKLKGVVISTPTVSLHQNGHTCGLYAVDCASRHHRSAKPTLFLRVAYLPPRKSDMKPKASDSLRKHNGSTVGEVLSVTSLVKLVELTGNQGLVVEIESYEQFIHYIQAALKQDFPIILPFNNKDSQPHIGENATSAHWATIVGYYHEEWVDYLLFAQYGVYYQFKARQAFNSCLKTNPHYPECYFVKDKAQNIKWTKYLKAPVVAPEVKVRVVAATKLTDFFGKMVVVLPPDANKEEVMVQFRGDAQAQNKRCKK